METKGKRTKVVVSVLALAGLMVCTLSALAGDLEPNAPPGSTMKTLDEVEPRIPIPASATPVAAFVISNPGSYYLTGDRNASGTGITVDVNNVTIDLMGYQLIGPGSGSTYGITMYNRNNVEVRNGTVRNFGHSGIRAYLSSADLRVIGVRAVANANTGISLPVYRSLVKDCIAVGSGENGIYVSTGSTVTGNTVYDNNDGIYAGTGSTVTGNTVYNNSGTGISTGNGCTVTGNTAYSNGERGIYTIACCTVTGNTVYYNQWSGIRASAGCMVTGNTVYENNLSDTTDYAGIYAVSSYCLVKGNAVSKNKQNNIHVWGSGNAIEENLVTNSTGNGIYFGMSGNFYANNRASGNVTDYNDIPGNTDGGGNVPF